MLHIYVKMGKTFPINHFKHDFITSLLIGFIKSRPFPLESSFPLVNPIYYSGSECGSGSNANLDSLRALIVGLALSIGLDWAPVWNTGPRRFRFFVFIAIMVENPCSQ